MTQGQTKGEYIHVSWGGGLTISSCTYCTVLVASCLLHCMACQRQKGDSWLPELISLIPKLFVRFMSWYRSAETVLEV